MLSHTINTAMIKIGYQKMTTAKFNTSGYVIAKLIKSVTEQCKCYVKLEVVGHMSPLSMRLCLQNHICMMRQNDSLVHARDKFWGVFK
jgi:hypothetical protein